MLNWERAPHGISLIQLWTLYDSSARKGERNLKLNTSLNLVVVEFELKNAYTSFHYAQLATAPKLRIHLFTTIPILACALLVFPMILAADIPVYDANSQGVKSTIQHRRSNSNLPDSTKPSVMSYHGNSFAETLVDFERGIITISADDTASVKQAAIEILLTQFDPGVIDASTASDFGLINTKTQVPFFHEQVVDQDGLPIASVWRANRYVDYLLDKQQSDNPNHLNIPMTVQHTKIAGNKYLAFAKAASEKHRIPVPLIMAIIETESAFNPLARSRSNALGLMQIKADTAGRDYFSIINGDNRTPSSAYLYNPENNIEVGTGYLSILADHYLAGIYHPQKLQYAIIASYNGGAGNLFASLVKSGRKRAAIARINEMKVEEFYWFLTNRHNRQETRNYAKKVTARMEKYRTKQ